MCRSPAPRIPGTARRPFPTFLSGGPPTEYELVHEIKNHCPNNQMRDIFIEEVETDDPVTYVRARLVGHIDELTVNERRDGVTIHAVCDGLRHEFNFTL